MLKNILIGCVLYILPLYGMKYASDGKPIYEPIDISVKPKENIIKPIDDITIKPTENIIKPIDNITIKPKENIIKPMSVPLYYPLPDSDNDGINNDVDNCKYIANKNQFDFDKDGIGDVCDVDDDNDGVSDIDEINLGSNPKDNESYPIIKDNDTNNSYIQIDNNNTSSIFINENNVIVGDFNIWDKNITNTTYQINGIDANLFAITNNHTLEFIAPPDFENPQDSDKNNTYNITLIVKKDNTKVIEKSLNIIVTDVFLDHISDLSVESDSLILNEGELNVTVYDMDLEKYIQIKNYNAKVLGNNHIAFIGDNKLYLSKENISGKVDILFTYKDLSLIKTFEVMSLSKKTLKVDTISYKNNPYKLELSQNYYDELTDVNNDSDKTRWYKFKVRKGLYKLVYNPSKEKNAVYPKGTNITYNLYYKNQEKDNLHLIGSKTFSADNFFVLDLALDSNKTYYLEFQTDEDLWTVKYNISLMSYLSQIVYNEHLYFKRFVLDENGEYTYDTILPIFITYNISVESDKNFSMDINKNRLVENKRSFNQIKKYKEGRYKLKFKGEPSQVIYLTIDYNYNDYELESNNNYLQANIYNNTNTIGKIDNKDIDNIAFVTINKDIKVNFNIDFIDDDNSEIIRLNILNATGDKIASKTIFASKDNKNLLFDFKEFNLKPNTYYILKISKANPDTNTNITYSLTIDNTKRVLTKKEEAYLGLFEKINTTETLSLDEELNIITKKYSSDDIGTLIILTGDSDNPTDTLYQASQKLSKTFYQRFSLRGFGDDDIYWINANTQVDIDGDGKIDKVVDSDDLSTKNFFNVLKKEEEKDKKGPLYIYMVDHGANGAFLLSHKDIDKDGKKEILFSGSLKRALSDFIDNTDRKVVLIIEACKSGSFIIPLSTLANDIAIITSSDASKLSYIDTFGNVSFTKFFADELLSGKTIFGAYTLAKRKLRGQGGIYSKQSPLFLSYSNDMKNIKVGGNFSAAGMSLTSIDSIWLDGEKVDENSTKTIDLLDKKTISIKADITAGSGINKVWATVITPDYIPPKVTNSVEDFVTPDLSKYTITLKYNKSTKQYEGVYTIPTSKTYSGVYDITVYVEDTDGLVYSKNTKANGNGESEVPVQIDENSKSYKSGWNMVALPTKEDMSYIDGLSNIKIVWRYEAGQWKAYSPDEEIESEIERLSNIEVLQNTQINKGYWILSNTQGIINYETNDTIQEFDVANLQRGWSMISLNEISDAESYFSDTSIKSVWFYKDGKWYANVKGYTLPNNMNLTSLDKYDAVWVFKE